MSEIYQNVIGMCFYGSNWQYVILVSGNGLAPDKWEAINSTQGSSRSIMLYGVTSGPFYKHGLISIPACISNHIPSKVWDGITYPILNFTLGMDK